MARKPKPERRWAHTPVEVCLTKNLVQYNPGLVEGATGYVRNFKLPKRPGAALVDFGFRTGLWDIYWPSMKITDPLFLEWQKQGKPPIGKEATKTARAIWTREHPGLIAAASTHYFWPDPDAVARGPYSPATGPLFISEIKAREELKRKLMAHPEMTDPQVVTYLRDWVKDKGRTRLSWPTDMCGYKQHLRFVWYRNEYWTEFYYPRREWDLDPQREKEIYHQTWLEFVLRYAQELEEEKIPTLTGLSWQQDQEGES